MTARAVSCSHCLYWRSFNHNVGLCRRHAPGPGGRADEIAHWPETRSFDRCAEGRDAAGSAEPDKGGPVGQPSVMLHCTDCMHWHQPHPGAGLDPVDRGDERRAWWDRAGRCMRHAPWPGGSPGTVGYWRATHHSDGCGEGEAAPPQSE